MDGARLSGDTSDEDLWARQAALQAEAAAILADLDLAAILGDVGPMLLAGSYVSGLMCWPDLDVMVLPAPTSLRKMSCAYSGGSSIGRESSVLTTATNVVPGHQPVPPGTSGITW
jgi:hypothetical protein